VHRHAGKELEEQALEEQLGVGRRRARADRPLPSVPSPQPGTRDIPCAPPLAVACRGDAVGALLSGRCTDTSASSLVLSSSRLAPVTWQFEMAPKCINPPSPLHTLCSAGTVAASSPSAETAGVCPHNNNNRRYASAGHRQPLVAAKHRETTFEHPCLHPAPPGLLPP
jgi:hypothetical protein